MGYWSCAVRLAAPTALHESYGIEYTSAMKTLETPALDRIPDPVGRALTPEVARRHVARTPSTNGAHCHSPMSVAEVNSFDVTARQFLFVVTYKGCKARQCDQCGIEQR